MMSRTLLVTVLCVVLLGLAGCGNQTDQHQAQPAKLTTSQRDSVTAASRLPGAGAVKGALVDADSAAARAARANAASK